jgi:beta-glucosidase
MGVAFIKGMQGNDPYYLKAIATPKHFMANNEEERRHTGSSDVDMRSMFEYYLPAFKQAIVEGKAYSIMGAYNELNHVPCNANTFLLNDLLRRNWGFEGYVVSDCGAVNDMAFGHRFFKTGAEAAARSILAGCDLDCGTEYRDYLPEALKKVYWKKKILIALWKESSLHGLSWANLIHLKLFRTAQLQKINLITKKSVI